jgi:hypothetical protein
MWTARPVGPGFSPLDEELQLVPGTLTPRMHAHTVRFGGWLSFHRAADEMAWHHEVTVSKEHVRRATEQAGAAYMQVQIQAPPTSPDPTPVPDRQMLSVDGAMVHVTNGEWREVKTLVVAEVQPDGQAAHPSYFSRKAEHHEFAAEAEAEVKRRQVQRSAAVCAVADGADYNQRVIDRVAPRATRILDFYHGAEHLAVPLRAVYGEETEAFAAHFQQQRRELRDGAPDQVLAALSDLAAEHPAHAEVLNATLGYFIKRRDQINYADFQAAPWPIGSGAASPAHKVVVEARLKQAGMRWAEDNVNPMVALRNLICNNRWDEGWPLITALLRHPQQPTVSKPLDRDQVPSGQLPAGFALQPAPSWRYRPVGSAQRAPAPADAKT